MGVLHSVRGGRELPLSSRVTTTQFFLSARMATVFYLFIYLFYYKEGMSNVGVSVWFKK